MPQLDIFIFFKETFIFLIFFIIFYLNFIYKFIIKFCFSLKFRKKKNLENFYLTLYFKKQKQKLVKNLLLKIF